VDKLRVFYNHPDYVEACADGLRDALKQFENPEKVHVVFTAHSIPLTMAETSDYRKQLLETSRLVAEGVAAEHWKLAYQSRSGAPNQPWLEPDILDYLRELAATGVHDVVVAPIGFTSDHMEILYDLDIEAKDLATELGMKLVRAATVGTHPTFVRMIRELIEERLDSSRSKVAIGKYGANHDVCPPDCCPAPARLAAMAERPLASVLSCPARPLE
jgi:ferrochelatase